MASHEWLSLGHEAGVEAAGVETAAAPTSTPTPSESPSPQPALPEPPKSELSKLISEVAARYSESVPAPEPSSAAPQPDAFAWQRGGPSFLPEEDETDGSGEGGAREDKLAREVEQLKKTLEAQQKATREAEKNAASLSEQLASTRAQVEKSVNQVHGGQRARIERAESSVVQLKSEMHQAQRSLETERRARRAEAVAAAAKVAEAERERSSAIAAQAAAKSGRPASFRIRIGLTAAAGFAAVAAILLYWGFAPSTAGHSVGQPAPNPAAASSSSDRPVAGLPRSIEPVAAVKGVASKPTDKTNDGDFTQSMDRLSKALTAFPGLAPEEVLRQISLTGNASQCAFNWNNGNPALIYTAGKISMAQALDRCAAAIEKYR